MLPTLAEHIGGTWRDKLGDVGWYASFVAAYAVVDVATRGLADYRPDEVSGSGLLVGAVAANPLAAAAIVAFTGLALVRSPERFVGSWSSLEQGGGLRLFVVPLILLLAWQGALQPYDFQLDQSNIADRLLLVGLGIGAMARPGFLLAFVAQQRIMAAPLAFPFGILPGHNIDELLAIVLAVVAGGHLLRATTRRDDLSPMVAVIIAAVATHFFVPGFAKVRSGWLFDEDLRYLPPNAYAAGWLGQTDGGQAARLSGLLASAGIAVRIATLVFELGAAVAAMRHRWFRWWLLPAIGFHLVNFVTLGYWFLGWILVEVGLIVLLGRREVGSWLDHNLSPARSLAVLVTVVVAGTTLFHPPRLSWFDSPVGEGYRIEAVGESGASYHVPFAALAPFEEDLAFAALVLGETAPITGPYGVVGSHRLQELETKTERANIDDLRHGLDSAQLEARDRSEAFLADWLARANARAGGDGPALDRLWSLRAPTWFWTGRPEPTYRFDEPIRSLRVDRITSLTTEDDIVRWSTTVLVMDVDADGEVTVSER